MNNNFFQTWKVNRQNEKQFIQMGPYRPTCGKSGEQNKAKMRNLNMLLSVILRNPYNWRYVWRNRYNLICDFALNGQREHIFQRLGKKNNIAVIELHHAIQIPNPNKGKSPVSANKKFMVLPNDDFRRFRIAHHHRKLVEFMGIVLISRNTHGQFKSFRYENIDKEWYKNNGIHLPSYWNDKKVFAKAVREINSVFDTQYDEDLLWHQFNESIHSPCS